MMTFRERADAFWDWFAANEAQVADRLERRDQYDAEDTLAFVQQGTGLIEENLSFNMGGEHAFSFAVEGKAHLFYLLPWLVARQPERLRGKWAFFPCMPGSGGSDFDFVMYGKRILMSDVLVAIEYDADAARFGLSYHNPQLAQLDEAERANAFAILMELTIGEGMARIYVAGVAELDAPREDMFPLTELERRMLEVLAASGQNRMDRPDECYTAYELEPQEDGGMRYDVITGTSCFTDLLDDYYGESAETADCLQACGAAPVFLSFAYGEDDDRGEVLQTRYEITDRLESEALGERGSGRETGIVLGGAMGLRRAYIDLLLYDEPAFMERARKVLGAYPYTFELSPFRCGAQPVALDAGR